MGRLPPRDTSAVGRREFLGGLAAYAASGVVGCRHRERASRLDKLVVGGLPVTCNLTLPIACTARAAARDQQKTSGAIFEYSKYSGWPELKESLMSGRVQAAYMLAPLVMDLST